MNFIRKFAASIKNSVATLLAKATTVVKPKAEKVSKVSKAVFGALRGSAWLVLTTLAIVCISLPVALIYWGAEAISKAVTWFLDLCEELQSVHENLTFPVAVVGILVAVAGLPFMLLSDTEEDVQKGLGWFYNKFKYILG